MEHCLKNPSYYDRFVPSCLRLVAQKKNEAFSGLKAEQLLSINQADSLSALIDQTLQILTHCIDDLNGTSDTSYHHIVKDCLTYIEAHYTEDISISKAALDIHVNADYLPVY